MKALVLGGTRYFGKRLVERLAADGFEVTIASRTTRSGNLDQNITHRQLDRNIPSTLNAIDENWDIVFDQICSTEDHAATLTQLLNHKIGKLVFTSSASVYESGQNLAEKDIDTSDYLQASSPQFEYRRGKRQAEHIYCYNASFPSAAVRFPIVLGPDDYTERLLFHAERIFAERPLFFPNLDAKISFVSSKDAADFLVHVGRSDIRGPINACSSEPIALKDLISMIEEVIGKKAIMAAEPSAANHSPFGVSDHWYLDSSLSTASGFEFQPIESWIIPILLGYLQLMQTRGVRSSNQAYFFQTTVQ